MVTSQKKARVQAFINTFPPERQSMGFLAGTESLCQEIYIRNKLKAVGYCFPVAPWSVSGSAQYKVCGAVEIRPLGDVPHCIMQWLAQAGEPSRRVAASYEVNVILNSTPARCSNRRHAYDHGAP